MNDTLIIIPHFNKLSLLKECIDHLMLQSSDDFDVMIVDNGSTDGSVEYIQSLSSSDSRFHFIFFNDNMGFAYAVNKGILYSIKNGYKYSLLLNNDAYVENDFVKNIEKRIKSSSKLFAVSSLMLSYKDREAIDSFGDYYTILGWSFQGHLAENVKNLSVDEKPFSACAGASIYSNSILDEIGLFDENFFAYLEDIDISYRARLYNYKISTCKDAVCYHLGSQTSGSKYNKFKVRLSSRNNIYLIYKNMPNLQIAINFIPLFVGTFIKFVFFIFRGFGFDYISGIIDGFKNLYRIKRRDFKKIRAINFFLIECFLIQSTFMYIFNFIKRHKK